MNESKISGMVSAAADTAAAVSPQRLQVNVQLQPGSAPWAATKPSTRAATLAGVRPR
jgi:hypothetical protein